MSEQTIPTAALEIARRYISHKGGCYGNRLHCVCNYNLELTLLAREIAEYGERIWLERKPYYGHMVERSKDELLAEADKPVPRKPTLRFHQEDGDAT